MGFLGCSFNGEPHHIRFREGLCEEVVINNGKETAMHKFRKRAFKAEGRTHAKVLTGEWAWGVQVPEKRPVWYSRPDCSA